MKISIICFLEFSELPPANNLANVLLDLGHDITIISLTPENSLEKIFFEKKVHLYSVLQTKAKVAQISYSGKFTDRIHNKISSLICKFLEHRKISHAIESLVKEINLSDLVWVLHEHTAKYVSKAIISSGCKYYFTVYELDNNSSHNEKLIKFAQSADKVFVPEYCRAHIIKAWWGLKKLPEIIPNKPYVDLRERNQRIMNKSIGEKINALKGKKIIMYQGIFLPERRLDTFIEAVSELGDEYVFVTMGHTNIHLHRLQKKYEGKFEYLGYLEPPEHLQITSHAFIGVLTYVATSTSINPIFCAPNKIYEYSEFGIPMIGNDIPGLRYSLEYNNIGKCVNIDSVDEIKKKIMNIADNYEKYSINAREYFENTDIKIAVENML